jgi:hypothetical protein
MGSAEPVETGNAPGNSAGHDNPQQSSHLASTKASAAAELTEPGASPGHNNSEHPSPSAPTSAMAAAEPVETGNAPGNSAGNGNAQHASNSAAAKASAAIELTEPGVTPGHVHEPAFHFKNQGVPSTPIEAIELEQLNDWPVLLGHAGDLAEIPQVGPAAMEEHAASHVNNGQHHAIGHLPHDLLI